MASKENKKSPKSPQPRKKSKHLEAKAPAEPTNGNRGLTIVGIGASAGGLNALNSFFDALSPNTGMVYVVVTHLHPAHESHMPELVQRHTPMPVLQVKQRVPVEPDHVYVIPPNRGIILTWLSAQMREQYGLRVTLHANGVSKAYEDTLRILVFQAVREALFNVVKHAHTDRASIDFEAVNGDTRLTVSDEGEGFSPQLMNDNDGGGGLRNLRHRLNLMGCRLEINSRPGAGTQVIIDIPQNR